MAASKKRLSFSWQEWLVLLLALVMAFAVRTHNLAARSLWVDEGISLHRSQQTPATLLDGTIPIDGGTISDPTPPLHAMLLAVVQWPAGDSVFALRLLSVWLGMLGLALLFVLGRRLFKTSGGLAAALLGALSPYWVWYNQSARPDSLLLTTALLSVLSLHRLLKPRHFTHRRSAVWALATIAMLYTHQAALWVLAFELVIFSFHCVRHRRVSQLLWLILVLLAAAPLLGQVWNGQDVLTQFRPSWDQARQLATGSSPEPSQLTLLRLLPTALLLLAASAWLLWFPRRTRAVYFSLTFLLIPITASYFVGRYLLDDTEARYLVVSMPALYLLQGAGAGALWKRWRPLAMVTFIGAALIMSQWLYVQTNDPTFAEEDLRTAARYASTHTQADDVVVLHNALIQPVWNYYYDGAAPVEVVPHYAPQDPSLELDRLQSLADAHNQVWFLYRPESTGGQSPGPYFEHAETEWIKFDQKDFSSSWMDVDLGIYASEPPVVETLPAGSQAMETCWLTGLCLHGWSTENWRVGENAQITLYWSQNNSTQDRYQLSLHLQDAEKQQWLEHTAAIFPFYPATRWPSGQMLAQRLEVPLSPALPIITDLALELEVWVDAEDGASRVSTNNNGNRVTLGEISLSRPAEPIPAEELTLQYQHEAEFGNVVQFLGYNLPTDTPRPGHTTFIDLYWQALASPSQSWQQHIQLLDADGQVWTEVLEPLGPSQFDVLQWQPGDLIWEPVFLALPGQMPAGEFKIQITLLDADNQPVLAKEIWRAEPAASIVAGPAYLDPWPMVTEHSPMPHQADSIFGGARLWGYQIEGEAKPGDNLQVTLVWRDEVSFEQDYTVFVHVMNEQEQLLTQSDGVPANWTRPTSSWRPGEFIVDQHQLALPADTPAGPVYLWAGMYNESGRLPVANPAAGQPADRVLLDILIVEP